MSDPVPFGEAFARTTTHKALANREKLEAMSKWLREEAEKAWGRRDNAAANAYERVLEQFDL